MGRLIVAVLAALVIVDAVVWYESSRYPLFCFVPDHSASVVRVVSPDYPADPALRHTAPASTLVKVTVEPDGRLSSATIYRSSGYQKLDDAAESTVRRMTYAPGAKTCVPIRTSALVRVSFDPRG